VDTKVELGNGTGETKDDQDSGVLDEAMMGKVQ